MLATGFQPKRSVAYAIDELAKLYRSGDLQDEDRFHNLKWMQREVVR
jgi:hypothetical protein